MAEQNIKMNVKTDTGYDTLYPQTKADIVSFNDTQSIVKGKTVLENLKNTANALYRPNLLINGDFQCNQRGKNYYNANGYSLDMWNFYKHNGGDGVVNIVNGIPVITKNTSSFIYLSQVIPNSVKGKKITLSVLTGTVGGESYIGIGGGNSITSPTATYGKQKLHSNTVNKITINIPNDEYNLIRVFVLCNSSNLSLQWIRADIGDVAYPHVKEDYELALTRCTQYLKTFKGQYTMIPAIGLMTQPRQIEIPIDLTSLKKKGTITHGQLSVRDGYGSAYIYPTSITMKSNSHIEINTSGDIGSVNRSSPIAVIMEDSVPFCISCEPL